MTDHDDRDSTDAHAWHDIADLDRTLDKDGIYGVDLLDYSGVTGACVPNRVGEPNAGERT